MHFTDRTRLPPPITINPCIQILRITTFYHTVYQRSRLPAGNTIQQLPWQPPGVPASHRVVFARRNGGLDVRWTGWQQPHDTDMSHVQFVCSDQHLESRLGYWYEGMVELTHASAYNDSAGIVQYFGLLLRASMVSDRRSVAAPKWQIVSFLTHACRLGYRRNIT
jgi:hypothetical protein